MKLSQAFLPGLLASIAGSPYRSLELTNRGVDFSGRESGTVDFTVLSDSPSLKLGLLSSTITLHRDQSDPIMLRGAPKAQAQAFRDSVEKAWRAFNLAELDREQANIEALLVRLSDLDNPTTYPSACRLEPVFRESRDIWIDLIRKLQPAAIGPEQVARLAPIEVFAESPQKARAAAVDRFVEAELSRWKDFFDTVESKPLTPEQRLSIVVDEDATLVLAGAGSGKTSVITAKAAYLLKAGIRPAEHILLLAFAKDAATEMSERIEARCGMPIEARTFHALAYDIIGQVEGSKPALAPHATDDTACLALIRDILKDLVSTVRDVARAIVAWFAHFLVPAPEEQEFETKHEWYSAVEKLDLRTLQGEQVKSFEELEIANWLYENGIEYEYEPTYEHSVSTEGRRDYTPDFRLKGSGVYIEHFGVRRKRGPDGKDVLTTAPYVDRDEYLAGMAWKRQVHAEHGTTLIETFSYERSEGRLLEDLEEKLAPHVTLNPRPLSTIFDRVVEMGQVDAFSRMLGTFLRQFKSGGYQIGACTDKAERLKMGRRGRAFLAIFEPVYTEYEPHRVCRRLQLLSKVEHHEQDNEQVFSGSA